MVPSAKWKVLSEMESGKSEVESAERQIFRSSTAIRLAENTVPSALVA